MRPVSLSLLKSRRALLVVAALALSSLAVGLRAIPRDAPKPPPQTKPALTVTLIAPEAAELPRVIAASGSIAAWQEAVIGAETSGYRLTEVRVNVGDVVRRGQLLAQVASDVVAAELAQSRAAVEEAAATVAEARANAERARRLQASGMISAQMANQALTAEQTALARLNGARARVAADEVRLSKTRVVAPDDGVISARSATVGAMAQPGQELFRLIRGGRLEWRAEVTAEELARIKPGMAATIASPGTPQHIRGTVRMLAPTVDPQTRNAIVYVDLPGNATATTSARAGMFARGEFELGKSPALTLPQSAVVQREGFNYVYRLEGADKVAQTKIAVGRRLGDRIEVTGGLEPASRVVAAGGGFLADGDTVRVVGAASTAQR